MTQPVRIGLALDMDYLIFSAMSASETEQDWGDDIWTLECDHAKARSIMFGTIKTIKKEITKALMKRWPKRFPDENSFELVDICVISGKGNWRLDVLETYKGNRVSKRKPVGYPAYCDAMMDHYENAVRVDGREGDDTLGILMTNPGLVDCDRVIGVSCDKDFNTIPGLFFWLTPMELVVNTEADADKWHMRQTMMGDTTDGYGGIPGVGEAFEGDLMAWLDNPKFYERTIKVMSRGPRKGQEVVEYVGREPMDGETLWDCMVSLAAAKGMSEEDLLVQARVARILRHGEWNDETAEPVLWSPRG
ncbi:putative exonuclease [Pseudomonas phage phiIBB-PF7A]|uniref:Putative exonuclease n=1 Tax=Pseudomonas phage phiIBB-PF7A TaxID=942165 RepID=E9KIG0_9CAUD|nr:putative exonuclease [Pseudomonas phage phiIBB-PF7A]ADV35685.1 putative exonuclease [Pseudomonas phage phiIBB-PF7A]